MTDIVGWLQTFKEEFAIVVLTLKDKGVKRFSRAFVVAGAVLLAAYLLVYKPPQRKSALLKSQIEHAKTLSSYGAQFKGLRDQLNLAYVGLPALTDREQWLANSVRDSLLAGNLQPKSFSPVKESETNGLVFQTAAVSLTMSFSQFYDWLLRIENSKPMMRLKSLELKKSETLGFNSATCDILTVVPKRRFH